jgi:hypothetical protein
VSGGLDQQQNLTAAEANNAIFVALKFGWSWLNPSNEIIDTILMYLPERPSPHCVVDAVAQYVWVATGGSLSAQQFKSKLQRSKRVLSRLLQQPSSLRNDLGLDADYVPRVTKH